MRNGILKVKLKNLSNPSQNAIGNSNPMNWKEGQIGVDLTIGKISYNVINPQEGALSKLTSLDNSIGAPDPTNITNPIRYTMYPPIAQSTKQPDKRFKTKEYSVGTMPPGLGGKSLWDCCCSTKYSSLVFRSRIEFYDKKRYEYC